MPSWSSENRAFAKTFESLEIKFAELEIRGDKGQGWSNLRQVESQQISATLQQLKAWREHRGRLWSSAAVLVITLRSDPTSRIYLLECSTVSLSFYVSLYLYWSQECKEYHHCPALLSITGGVVISAGKSGFEESSCGWTNVGMDPNCSIRMDWRWKTHT